MKFVLFYHSLVSDWNHGNAHFLRGVARALMACGHAVSVYEPQGGWSRSNLRTEHSGAEAAIAAAFGDIACHEYTHVALDLEQALDGADVVIVHEWNEPALVARLGRHRRLGGRYHLLFHDTHHRALTAPDDMARFDLDGYDGVLAFGEAVREIYLRRGWARRTWTWHEAADVSVFRPLPRRPRQGDVVWIGNWGDGERTQELTEYLIEPIHQLRLRARIHGVRYPDSALALLARAGIAYAGWLANHRAPEVFAGFGVTVHVPRRPYVTLLPGIPTIRVFEALACGIPLISAPWDDDEGLFTPGRDFLMVRDGKQMMACLRTVLDDADAAAELAAHGLDTIRSRHTCGHRVEELLAICAGLTAAPTALPARQP